MATIGLLYPGHSADDDYPRLETRLLQDAPDAELRLPLAHTSVGEDAHRVDALLELGSNERLAQGARSLLENGSLDALMWACTSGSFVFGWQGAHDQVAALSGLTGVPASSTSLAFVQACQSLGVERVAVAASYPQDVAEHFVSFLSSGGIEVTAIGSHGIETAAEVGTLGREQVMALVEGVSRHGAQAVLVPDTAMHTLSWIDDLEGSAGLPVLTANQVTIHEGLRLLGPVPRLPGLGTLFAPSRRSS